MRRSWMLAVFIMLLEPCTRTEKFTSRKAEFLALTFYEVADESLYLVRIFDILESNGMVALIGGIQSHGSDSEDLLPECF